MIGRSWHSLPVSRRERPVAAPHLINPGAVRTPMEMAAEGFRSLAPFQPSAISASGMPTRQLCDLQSGPSGNGPLNEFVAGSSLDDPRPACQPNSHIISRNLQLTFSLCLHVPSMQNNYSSNHPAPDSQADWSAFAGAPGVCIARGRGRRIWRSPEKARRSCDGQPGSKAVNDETARRILGARPAPLDGAEGSRPCSG